MRSFEPVKGFRKGPKSLSSDLVAVEWCPTMDLLALATENRQLMVYRAEGWQRLWQSSFAESITCLTWRPDGQARSVTLFKNWCPRMKLNCDLGTSCCGNFSELMVPSDVRLELVHRPE